MKTNIFNVKDKSDKKIIIEEERLKNPFLLFFKKNKKNIVMTLLMLVFCLLLVSVGLVFSLFRGTNDYDITYITGSEQIGAITDPDIDDEDIIEELLGEIARAEGVVILVESFLSPDGDVIYYYTDGSSIMVTSKGKIYRISTDENGDYGVSRNGKIDDSAKKILVTSTTSNLDDGSIITNYSDGTAMVELNNEVIFVRDSNNVELFSEKSFNRAKPSGVALAKNNLSINNGFVNKFSDGTAMVTIGGDMFIVNKNTSIDVFGGKVSYDKNNTFKVISEKEYSDGNIIRHFSNGSATITDKKGKVIYVRNSGDLVSKNKKLYEIMPNKKANSRGVVKSNNKSNIVYFDNGAAIIITPNNDRKYVEDADSIIYTNNKTIKGNVDFSKLTNVMVTEDGKKAYSFENGKTQVINSDNTSYIVDTDTLSLRPIEGDKVEEDDKVDDGEDNDKPEDDKDEGTAEIPVGDVIDMSEAPPDYDDPLAEHLAEFKIKNKTDTPQYIQIVIEELDDYKENNLLDSKFSELKPDKLEPGYVKFFIGVESESVVGSYKEVKGHLVERSLNESDGTWNYILYEGELKGREEITVSIILSVDYDKIRYENLDKGEDEINKFQNSLFSGTIKVYVDDKL